MPKIWNVSLPKLYKSYCESNGEGGDGNSGTCKSVMKGYYHHYFFNPKF